MAKNKKIKLQKNSNKVLISTTKKFSEDYFYLPDSIINSQNQIENLDLPVTNSKIIERKSIFQNYNLFGFATFAVILIAGYGLVSWILIPPPAQEVQAQTIEKIQIVSIADSKLSNAPIQTAQKAKLLPLIIEINSN